MNIRKGAEQDLEQALELIKELALFERAPLEVTNTVEKMREDGFGKNPVYEFYVAEEQNEIIGMALFYTRYSTWKGRCLYLEDIIVKEKNRGEGAGKLLFEKVISHAKQNGFVSVNWQVLDWNVTAINFYKKYNAQFDDEWLNGKIMLTN